jgi:hypothetical protein
MNVSPDTQGRIESVERIRDLLLVESEILDTQPDINVLEAEYNRLLGFPPQYAPEGRVRELADATRRWYAEHGRPWVYAREAAVETANGTLRIEGTAFSSKRLHAQLIEAEATRAMLVAVSAGKACEEKAQQLWQEGKPDEYFFLEAYGSAVVEHLITTTGARVCAWADQCRMAVLPHYSPGYSGWEIRDQPGLFELIRRRKDLPESIEVMCSGMLRPKKSLLAVLGITERLDLVRSLAKLSPCESCSYPSCQYRRNPYKHALAQIEDVGRLQSASNGERMPDKRRPPALSHNGAYSIHTRALRKWSNERLRLRVLPDLSVEAHFRYEGTTCSNLGRPLEYDYQVKLGSAEAGYPIVEANCRPAEGDTGHPYMCEYLRDAEHLKRSIEMEKPLAGWPLNEVLGWQRNYSPSGCYCDADSRKHKWGLVLEVIHYALVQREKGLNGK